MTAPTSSPGRWDIHSHVALETPDFAERYGDPRWPMLAGAREPQTAELIRDGRVVRTVAPEGWSPERRVEAIEAAGLARQVLSPLPPLLCDWADGALGSEWARRLNDAIADFAAVDDRLLAMGTVPLQDPDRAVGVLREAHTLGLVGVEIATTGGELELDDPRLTEFFAVAGELGMLVFVHPLIIGSDAGWTARITGQEVTFGLGMTTDTAIAATKLLFGGVLEANAGLKVCLAHGGGTLPWVLPRIARLWNSTHDTSTDALTEGLYVDTLVFEPDNIDYLVRRLGADHVLFGTDYPMPGGDSLDGAVFSHLPDAERAAVFGGNAARLLEG